MKHALFIFGIVFLCACEMKSEPKLPSLNSQQIDDTINDKPEKRQDLRQFDVPTTDCYFNQLSKQFNFRLNVRYHREDSAIIYVTTLHKKTDELIDSILIKSEYLMYPPMRGNCEDVRSYSTGHNEYKAIVDNSYGIFVVADFNFDQKDDFAVAVDNGGNGGYIYAFYLQTKNGGFVIDEFLSKEMLRFPETFDKNKQSLMTSVHANVEQNCETVYQLSGNTWKQTSQKLVP